MRKKNEHTINTKRECSDDGLPSTWIQYNQSSPSSLYSFCTYGMLFLSACTPGLVYLGPYNGKGIVSKLNLL